MVSRSQTPLTLRMTLRSMDQTHRGGAGFDSDALRIVLVGKTGCGKSSTGNTILGRKAFFAEADGKSVTQTCKKVDTEVDGRRVAVVDTPGLFDTTLSNDVTLREMSRSIELLAPGPHAFLLLVQIGRSTAEEQGALECITRTFGWRAHAYTMVLFTRGDDLEEEDMSVEEYIQTTDDSLKQLISACGDRVHVFNNRRTERSQVKQLLRKIDRMVEQNAGSYYTDAMLREAEAELQEENRRVQQREQEEARQEKEKMERKCQQEMDLVVSMERARLEEEKQQMKKKLREKEKQVKDLRNRR